MLRVTPGDVAAGLALLAGAIGGGMFGVIFGIFSLRFRSLGRSPAGGGAADRSAAA